MTRAARSSPLERHRSDGATALRPFAIADVEIANRVLLAPLAGIGNWFVRLQAQRHGAGLAVSEMVSSFALAHRNRAHARGAAADPPRRGPGRDPVLRPRPRRDARGGRRRRAGGADLIDLNMGCPVPKVLKTGAGAALLRDPAQAVAVARAAREGSGLPVTVKVRSGIEPGDRSGVDLAGGWWSTPASPRSPCTRARRSSHAAGPSTRWSRELARRLERGGTVPVIVSGGLRDAERARAAYEESGADAVMIARGSLGNPWIFEQLTGARTEPPGAAEIVASFAGCSIGRMSTGVRPRRAQPAQVLSLVRRAARLEGPEADRSSAPSSLDRVRELLAQGPSAGAPAGPSGDEVASL